MPPGVGQGLPDYAQGLPAHFLEGAFEGAVRQVQADVEIRGHGAVQFYERSQKLREGFVVLGLQAQVVDGAAQLLLDALERRGQPARPVRGLFPRGRGPHRLGLGHRVGQVLEGLVVQVAGNAAALGLPDLAELRLGLLALYRRGEHVGYGLQEVRVFLGEGPVGDRVRSQRPVGLLPAGDQDGHAADHAVRPEHGGRLEARLRLQVLEHHGPTRTERVGDLGVYLGRAPHRPLLPAEPRPQQQLLAAGQDLHDSAALHV